MQVMLAIGLALVLGASSVVAQPDIGAPNAAFGGANEGVTEWRALTVGHIAPSVLAWQLDPVGNARPPAATNQRALEVYREQHPTSAGGRMFADDAGVRGIVPADVQQTLLVLATAPGFERVRKIVEALDKPARRFEFEAQWVQITPEDATQLGFLMGLPSARQAHRTRADYREKLAELIAQDKTIVLNSQTFGAAQYEETRAILTQSAPLQRWPDAEETRAKTSLRAATTLAVTVMGSDVNRISLRVAIAREMLLAVPQENGDEVAGFRKSTGASAQAAPFPVQSERAMETSWELLDGQTLALSGFSTEWLIAQGQPLYDGKELPKNVVLLLTARFTGE